MNSCDAPYSAASEASQINTTSFSSIIWLHRSPHSRQASSPVPAKRVFTNCRKDAPQTMSDDGAGADPRQLENTYVLKEETIDPSYIIGCKPGVSQLGLY